MIWMYCKEDITSAVNRNKVYAKRGEKVFIFKRETETLVFCESETGNKFTCHIDELQNLKPINNVDTISKNKRKG